MKSLAFLIVPLSLRPCSKQSPLFGGRGVESGRLLLYYRVTSFPLQIFPPNSASGFAICLYSISTGTLLCYQECSVNICHVTALALATDFAFLATPKSIGVVSCGARAPPRLV